MLLKKNTISYLVWFSHRIGFQIKQFIIEFFIYLLSMSVFKTWFLLDNKEHHQTGWKMTYFRLMASNGRMTINSYNVKYFVIDCVKFVTTY